MSIFKRAFATVAPTAQVCGKNIARTVLTLAVAGTLSASVIQLVPLAADQQYQQTTNNPCLIGEPSCSQGTFPTPTFLDANAGSFDVFSPTYTVAELKNFGFTNFFVALDVNQTSTVQNLSLFEMLVNDVVVDVFNSPNTPVPPTAGGGNGNGYADYLLTGFTSLSLLNDTDEIQFRAVMPLVNDGREQFFLTAAPAPPPGEDPVPEPATIALVGGGLLLVGWYKRGRRTPAEIDEVK